MLWTIIPQEDGQPIQEDGDLGVFYYLASVFRIARGSGFNCHFKKNQERNEVEFPVSIDSPLYDLNNKKSSAGL